MEGVPVSGADMTRRHMEVYVALCDNNGNMTRSAEALYMAQPAVSRVLSELEAHYGVTFFARISRKLYITDAGRRFYDYAKQIVDLFSDVEFGIQHQTYDTSLRVGVFASIDACSLPQYISAFNVIHPGVTIKSYVDISTSLEEKLEHNELDMAIIDALPKSRNLVAKKYTAANVAFGISPKLGYTAGQTITIEELLSMPLLVRTVGRGVRTAFDLALAGRGQKANPVLESFSVTVLTNAARSGLGIVVLTEAMLSNLFRKGKLVRLTVEDLPVSITYYAVHHKDKEISRFIQDFMGVCEQVETI